MTAATTTATTAARRERAPGPGPQPRRARGGGATAPLDHPSARDAVTLLGWRGEVTSDALQEALDLSQPACVRVVDRLAAAGLVTRRRTPGDRRLRIALTDAGERAATRLVRDSGEGVQKALHEALPEVEDLDGFVAALDRVATVVFGDATDTLRFCRSCDVGACVRGPRGCPSDAACRANAVNSPASDDCCGPDGYRDYMSSSFSDDQLQPDDTLDDRGVDDILDEGMSTARAPQPGGWRTACTSADDAEGETLDDRLEQEEPDPAAAVDHTAEAQQDRHPQRGGCGSQRRVRGRRRADRPTQGGRGRDRRRHRGGRRYRRRRRCGAEEAAVHTRGRGPGLSGLRQTAGRRAGATRSPGRCPSPSATPARVVRSNASWSITPSWNHTPLAPTATAWSANSPAASDLRNTSTTSIGNGTSARVG